MPAGLLILVYKTCCGSNAIAQCVGNRSACTNIFAFIIENERKYGVTNPCGNVFVRDVDPHAKFGSIFKLLLFAQVCQRCHHITGFEGVTVVDIERHSAVAAVDLAGCRCYGIYLAFRQYIVVCRIFELKHACIAVFKVKNDLRALTKFDCGSCRNSCAHNCCGNLACGNAAVSGGEFKAVDCTDTIVIKGKLNVACLDFNFIENVCGCQCQSNGFAERNCHFAAVEIQFFGNNGMNGDRADLFAVVRSCQNNVADSCSCQNTVFICTVYNSVCDICRNFCRMTRGAYARDTDCNGRSRSCILGFDVIGNMIKGLGSYCRRNNDKTV